MTQVQVSADTIISVPSLIRWQNVFITPEGGMKATMAELERRKFTAEEGVSSIRVSIQRSSSSLQDHLTLLNVYNTFVRFGAKDKQWSGNHRINHKALSRAVSIRKQLKKYVERFNIPIVSCEGDAVRLRRCLVTGYFKVNRVVASTDVQADQDQNAARMMPDGTYRSAREGAVSLSEFVGLSEVDSLERFFTSILLRSCSRGSHPLDGSYITRWSKPLKVS